MTMTRPSMEIDKHERILNGLLAQRALDRDPESGRYDVSDTRAWGMALWVEILEVYGEDGSDPDDDEDGTFMHPLLFLGLLVTGFVFSIIGLAVTINAILP